MPRSWRHGEVLIAQKRLEEIEIQLDSARCGFEALLAFADHGVEFYAGTGADSQRALELALANVANCPRRRAISRVHAIVADMFMCGGKP